MAGARKHPGDEAGAQTGRSGMRTAVDAVATVPHPVLQMIVDRFPDGIVVHRMGRIVYANAALGRMLGYNSADDLVLREWRELIHPDELADVIRNGERSLTAPEWTAFPTVRRRLVGKIEITAELSTLRIGWNGAPALAVVVRDLGDRERLESQLREAERMAAVGTLAAGVAHEVNNPLAYVVANIAFLVEQLPRLDAGSVATLRPELEEALHEAQQGVERVRQIVSDLKTFTRSEDQEERVDLISVVGSTLKMARPGIRHGAEIVTDYAKAPAVKANASRLAQVLLNLLVNASQAAGDEQKGKLTIRVSVDTTPSGEARVRVADNGKGIPPDVLPRVFEPFFTTKPVGVGTGLGLSVCRNIVDKYGGRISIESTLEAGTTVSLVLPPAPADFAPHRSSAAMHAVKMNRYRILLVDDDQLVLKSMQRLLRRHNVTAMSGGAEALALLEEDSGFDIILCDLMMPDVTGMDVYERLAARGGGLERRIVFLSGGAVTERAQSLLASAPNLRFEKPVDPKRIELLLQSAVERTGGGT